jgi:SAM-dependent methyltransferase
LNQKSSISNIRVIDADMQTYLQGIESDGVDFITSSYAIHHLHPEDQLDLAKNAHRCIKSGGAFLLADPQEGKSDFNLKVLHREEPEGVFAAFSSPESMTERLTLAGFSTVQVLIRDDTNYTGFALAAIKQVVSVTR